MIKQQSDQVSAQRKIDELIAGLGDWRGERLAEVRKLIHDALLGVNETWKWMGSPVWEQDGISPSEHRSGRPQPSTVRPGGSGEVVGTRGRRATPVCRRGDRGDEVLPDLVVARLPNRFPASLSLGLGR